MSQLAAAIKADVSRLSSKIIRKELSGLKARNAAYRSNIAALKRELADLRRTVALLQKQLPDSDPVKQREDQASADDNNKKRRYREGTVAAIRTKLGITQQEMATLCSVSPQSIFNWESGRTRPSKESHLERLATLRTMGKREVAKILDGATG